MARRVKLVLKCFSPLSEPGNHGSDPTTSLQVAPFQSENNSIWIGYHDQPSRKYLGVFPSFDEVIGRCQRNALAGGANAAFPRFVTEPRQRSGIVSDPDRPGRYLKHVCCAGCQNLGSDCEKLTLDFLPVATNNSKYRKVFLVEYRFYLRGEQMVALLLHASQGRYCFQKTDGTLSRVLAMDSKHRCLYPSEPSSAYDSEENSDSSSLTQFDCVEDEDATDVRSRCKILWIIITDQYVRLANRLVCLYDPVNTTRHKNKSLELQSRDHRHKPYLYRKNRYHNPALEVVL